MEGKLPYYMVYPMPFIYDDERLEQRDYEYMRSLYPDAAKRILPYVEEECDRSDGPCSMMYDEYPDRLQLRLMGNRIYDKVMEKEKRFLENEDDEEMKGVEGQRRRKEPRNWLRDLIDVMLYQELYKRRSENRRMRQRYY